MIKSCPFIPLIVFLLLCAVDSGLLANPIYDAAYQQQKAGQHEEALEGFLKAALEARREGNSLTEFSSYYFASYCANRLDRSSDCCEFAEKALAIVSANQSQSWTQRRNQPIFEVELLGLIERSHFQRARLGDGWQANRRGVEFLREKYGTDGTGYLKPDEVLKFPSELRAQGWRYIEREADYLYETGETNKARELLNAAIKASGRDLRSSRRDLSFYSLKLVGKLAIIEGFLGNELRAIELYELEYKHAKNRSSSSNLIRVRLNLLSEMVDYYGADDSMLEEADALMAEAESIGGSLHSVAKRVYDRIAANSRTLEERIESLVEAAVSLEDSEMMMASFYSSRDALFIRAANNEPDLDDEFMEFLWKSRSQGNYRAEPRIYRRYGDWLRLQARFTESIRMYHISLERSLVTELHAQVINIYCKLAATYLDAGQSESAFAMIARMEDYRKLNDSISAHSIIGSIDQWILALLKHGFEEEARATAAIWYKFGVSASVPSIHLDAISPEFIDAYLARHTDSVLGNDEKPITAFIHPLSVTTIGLQNQSPLATFFLLNPGVSAEVGELVVSGTKLAQEVSHQDDQLNLIVGSADGSDVLRIPLTIPSGVLNKIYIETDSPLSEGEVGDVRFDWSSDNPDSSRAAIWNYSVEGGADYAVVTEAAEIELNPYIGLPVEHFVHFPETLEQQASIGFRIRSTHAFRIEYRHPTTGKLLAVDNNGNGDFSESGDFWTQGNSSDDIPAPRVSRLEDEAHSSIEVWYFPTEDVVVESLELKVEIQQDGEWVLQAVDRIEL